MIMAGVMVMVKATVGNSCGIVMVPVVSHSCKSFTGLTTDMVVVLIRIRVRQLITETIEHGLKRLSRRRTKGLNIA